MRALSGTEQYTANNIPLISLCPAGVLAPTSTFSLAGAGTVTEPAPSGTHPHQGPAAVGVRAIEGEERGPPNSCWRTYLMQQSLPLDRCRHSWDQLSKTQIEEGAGEEEPGGPRTQASSKS